MESYDEPGQTVQRTVDFKDKQPPTLKGSPEPIAIIGMGCRFPGGADTPDLFWKVLKNGVDAIQDVPSTRWSVDEYYDSNPDAPGKSISRWAGLVSDDKITGFDAPFFKVPPREAVSMDPQQRMFMEASWEALENAAIAPHSLKEKRVGVYLGVCHDDYKGSHLFSPELANIDAYSASGSMFSSAGGRLSYFLGLRGPNISVDTACSSSMAALHSAALALHCGECEMAVVGGVNALLSPNMFVYFSKLGVLSADGRCKTFDESANGYVRGEGCGVVILKPLSVAQRDGDNIVALIRSTALNQDGASSSFTSPDPEAQEEVIVTALETAGIHPRSISYVEGHGTGTNVGDPTEAQSLLNVYGQYKSKENPLYIGSAKTNIGHLEGGAGMAGFIKVALMLQKNTIAPNLHFKNPNPKVAWEKIAVRTTPLEWTGSKENPRRAGVNAFGFSGTNGHIILEEAPISDNKATVQTAQQDGYHVLPISAKSESALKELSQRYSDFLKSPQAAGQNLSDICHTAAFGRTHFGERLTVAGKDAAQLSERLSSFLSEPAREESGGSGDNRVVFLFTGQGTQYRGMCRQLYEGHPVFRRVMDTCNHLFKEYMEHSIFELIYPENEETAVDESLVHRTDNSQPLIFSVQCALAALWKSWGVQPAAVAGHSIGEFAAAVTAGVFSLEQGIKLVAERGRLTNSVPGHGRMMAVLAEEYILQEVLEPFSEKIAIATLNTTTSMVLSGDAEAMDQVEEKLISMEIKTKPLDVSHAFHSPMMNCILDEFEAVASEIDLYQPQITYFSGYDGQPASKELTDPHYWARHITAAVRFRDTVATMESQGYEIYLEIGVNTTLVSLAAQCVDNPDAYLFQPSMRKDSEDMEGLLTAVGQLYGRKVAVDWQAVQQYEDAKKALLPNYPFQRKEYWMPPAHSADAPKIRASTLAAAELDDYRPFIGRRIVSPAMEDSEVFQFFITLDEDDLNDNESNKNTPVHAYSFLKEHLIFDTIIWPAAAYLALMQPILRHSFSGDASLVNVGFVEPLSAAADRSKRVQTIINKKSDGRHGFTIVSRDANQQEGEWHTHCTGTLMSESRESSPKNLDEILTRTTMPVDAPAWYKEMAQLGYRIGPSFRSIKEIHRGNGEVLCRLRPAEDMPGSDFYVAHPGLMDSIIQTLLSLSGQYLALMKKTDKMFIPFSMGRMTLYNTPFKGMLSAHAKGSYQQDMVVGNVAIYNEDGEICLELEEFSLKMTDRKNMLKFVDTPEHRLLYTENWLEKELQNPKAAAPDGTYLIFADENFSPALQRELTSLGGNCILVHKNHHYHYENSSGPLTHATLDPRSNEHWQQLFQRFNQHIDTLQEEPRLQVLYLWGMDAVDDDPASQQQTICGSLLKVIQGIVGQSYESNLWVVTRNGQPVGKQTFHPDEKLSIAQSTLWGLEKVINMEHPELNSTILDIGGDYAQQAVNILNELASENQTPRAAYRGGVRYVPRLEKTALPAINNGYGRDVIHADSTYLITGGTGALGRVAARWLQEKGAKYVVLNGRHEPGPETSVLMEKLRHEGVETRFVNGDIANLHEAQLLIRRTTSEMPPLRGIIHAAGSLADGMVMDQSWDNYKKVFNPKVAGAWNMHQATWEIDLDFFIIFSSAIGLLGNRGQSNYCAANNFLDALAYYRRSEGLPAFSIDWGAWGTAGMSVSNQSVKNALKKQGFEELDPEDALQLMEKLIQAQRVDMAEQSFSCTRTAVLDCNWERYADYASQSSTGALKYLEKLVKPRTGKVEVSNILDQLSTASVKRRKTLITNLVRETAAAVAGLDSAGSLDLRAALIDQGFDSLMAVEFRNQLGKKISQSLPVTLLFKYPTVQKTAEYIDTLLPGKSDGAGERTTEIEKKTEMKTDSDQFAHLDDMNADELESLISEELKKGA